MIVTFKSKLAIDWGSERKRDGGWRGRGQARVRERDRTGHTHTHSVINYCFSTMRNQVFSHLDWINAPYTWCEFGHINDYEITITIHVKTHTHFSSSSTVLTVTTHQVLTMTGSPRRDHVWITTDNLFHFHEDKLDEMLCKLNSAKYSRAFQLNPTLP